MTYFTEYLEKCEDSDILDIVVNGKGIGICPAYVVRNRLSNCLIELNDAKVKSYSKDGNKWTFMCEFDIDICDEYVFRVTNYGSEGSDVGYMQMKYIEAVIVANATNRNNWKVVEYEDDLSGGFVIDVDCPIKVSTFEKYYKKGSAW